MAFNRNPKGRVGYIDTAETEDHVYARLHKLPPKLRDRYDLKNRVRCCAFCNFSKGRKHPLLWLTLAPSRDGAARLAGLLLELGESRASVVAALIKRRYYYGSEEFIQVDSLRGIMGRRQSNETYGPEEVS